jgi:ferredoxin-NADP reductase
MVKGATDSEGKFIAKPYTPTTLSDEKGHFELVIKVYPGGKVSGHLHGLKVRHFILHILREIRLLYYTRGTI